MAKWTNSTFDSLPVVLFSPSSPSNNPILSAYPLFMTLLYDFLLLFTFQATINFYLINVSSDKLLNDMMESW